MNFLYQDPYPILKDDTVYKKLTSDYVKVEQLGDREILTVDPKGLELLAEKAMEDPLSSMISPYVVLASYIPCMLVSNASRMATFSSSPKSSEYTGFHDVPSYWNKRVPQLGRM
jgi:hypothetical protein